EIRRKDGSIEPYSAGTFVDENGLSQHLVLSDFRMHPEPDHWTSPKTGASYPIRWKIEISKLGITLDIGTPLPSQELDSNSTIIPSYGEGAVTVRGTRRLLERPGVGYLEMPGYAIPPLGMGFKPALNGSPTLNQWDEQPRNRQQQQDVDV